MACRPLPTRDLPGCPPKPHNPGDISREPSLRSIMPEEFGFYNPPGSSPDTNVNTNNRNAFVLGIELGGERGVGWGVPPLSLLKVMSMGMCITQ
jgi:hypothetical protein